MSRETVTLSLDGEHLQELTSLVGAADVDAAIAAYVTKLHGLNEADEWIAELTEHASQHRHTPHGDESVPSRDVDG